MTSLVRAARLTGAAYLSLGITGMLGFLWIRPQIFEPGDPTATLANLLENPGLARAGLALELGIVLTQALVAVAFSWLFRSVSPTAAGMVTAFGLMNSAAILGSAAMLGGAVSVADLAGTAADPAGTVHLLYRLSEGFWAGGNIFFGLWLVPMGYLAMASGWMPRLLGRVLVLGGVGYVLAAFVGALVAQVPALVETLLTVPASIGEFWMIGYLLVRGVRPGASESSRAMTMAE